jgi:hypothetical protein
MLGRVSGLAWLVAAGAAIPGLAVLATGWGTPSGPVRLLFVGMLEVTAFATLALVVLWRGQVRRWPRRTVTRWIGGALGVSLALFLAYFLAYDATVKENLYDPDEPVLFVVPRPIAAWADEPFRARVACGLARDHEACGTLAPPARVTAEDIAEAKSYLNDALRIDAAFWQGATVVLLVLLYSAAAGSLVLLYGIVMARRLDVASLLRGPPGEG